MSASLLLNERFVAVFPSLVRALGGIADAAVLQEIHFQLQTGGKEKDGQRWVPATFNDLSQAVGLSPDAVNRTTKRLRDKGVLLTANPEAFQRRTWWRIDYDALNHLAETQNGTGAGAKSQVAKSLNPKRETASCTTSVEQKKKEDDISAPTGADLVKEFVDAFVATFGEQPDRQLVGRIGRDGKRMLSEGKDPDALAQASRECGRAGHGNLPSSYTRLLADSVQSRKRSEPRGFAGIRDFLEETS
jgi:DNA-binding Lrp family transcriptional regulator